MSNVDYAEIAKFEALAHRWWDRESEFKRTRESGRQESPRRRLRRRHSQ
jgi:2-polyprenyl-3-methyl-5-hydroxy-6-metoxy-1,4-benzoquinol methylase